MPAGHRFATATAVMTAVVLCRFATAAAKPAEIEIAPLDATATETRFPADVPRKQELVAGARARRCFLASGRVELKIVARWPESAVAETATRLDVRVENLFGDPPARTECSLEKTNSRVHDDGMREAEWRFSLDDNPGCGVWKAVATLSAPGTDVSGSAQALFEVLSDEADGQPPPTASRIPVLVATRPEAGASVAGFNPYGDGGQLFVASAARPSVAADLRLWDAVAPFSRRLFTCIGEDDDIRDESTCEAIRRSWAFQGDAADGDCGFFDFTRHDMYRGAQLELLRDYLAEKRPNLELLTLADANLRIGRGGTLSKEEFAEFFSKSWQEFLAFALERRRRNSAKFEASLLAVNPKLARGDCQPVCLDRCRSPYVLFAASRVPENGGRIRENGSFFMLQDSADAALGFAESCRRAWRTAYFAAGYALAFGDSRLLYPELDASNPAAAAYRLAMGTPYIKGGEYGYWHDDGFHFVDRADDVDVSGFAKAWGTVARSRPYHPCKSPFLVVDFATFKRVGDRFCGASSKGAPQVDNAAEFAVGRAYEQCVAAGYAPPVLMDLSDLGTLTADMAEFVVLPPLPKGTPPVILEAIRDANARGISFLALEEVAELEDLFGVRGFPNGARKIQMPGTCTETKELLTRYRPDGAEVVGRLNATPPAGKEVPVSFFKKPSGRSGALALASVPLGSMAMEDVMSRLAPRPAVKTETGTIVAAADDDGTTTVVVFADTPDFEEVGLGGVQFRFSVSATGMARMKVISDFPHLVESREADRMTICVTAFAGDVMVFRFEKTRNYKSLICRDR